MKETAVKKEMDERTSLEGEKAQFEKMTQWPIPKLIISLGIPTMLNMMVTSLYNLADAYFVAGLGQEAMGAVNVVLSLMSIIQAIGFTLGMGAGSIVSKLLGQRNQKQADTVATSAFFAAFICGLLVTVFGYLFLSPLMWLLGATEEVGVAVTTMEYAKQYTRYILFAAPFMCMSYVLNNVLRAQGKALLSMLGLISGAVINVILDPIFIYGANMAMRGAALATCVSQIISFCILLYLFLSGKTIVRVRMESISKKLSVYFDILATGFPSFCRQILASLCTVLLNWAVKPYDGALAALGVVQKVFMFAFSISLGIGQGYQPVLGYNYGCGRYERVKKAYVFTLGFSTALMIVFATVCAIFAPNIMRSFLDKENAINIGVLALRLQCICMPLLPINFMAGVSYQVVGNKFAAAILSISRQGLFYIPAVLILPRFMQLFGVQCCQSVSDFFSALFALPFTFAFFKSLKTASENSAKEEVFEESHKKGTDCQGVFPEGGFNVYDFDETILKGDTEIYFFKYVFKNYPEWKRDKLRVKFYSFLMRKKLVSLERGRSQVYRFLKKIPDIDAFVENFWEEHKQYLKKWYLNSKTETDVINSATPEFLLLPIVKELGNKTLIATKMDKHTGKVLGKWNSGEEKVRRLKEVFEDRIPDFFYSDSDKDLPMAKYAKKAFKVVDDDRLEWKFDDL